MTKIIKRNNQLFISIDGIETELVERDKFGSYKLPENPSNRHWYSAKKAENLVNEEILEYRETRTIGPQSSKKSWMDYLTDEEKEVLDNLKKIGEERKSMDIKKPLTEKEKLENKIKKLQQQLEGLSK